MFWNLILLKKTIFRQNPHDSASDHSNYVRNWEKSRFKLFNEILESDIWKWIRNKLISRKETNRGVPSYWQNIPEKGREFRIFFLWKMWRFPRNYELDCQIAKKYVSWAHDQSPNKIYIDVYTIKMIQNI